jgi:hypothetical protein
MGSIQDTMSYTIEYLSLTALLETKTRNDFIHFLVWLDKQHGSNWATSNAYTVMKCLRDPFKKQMTLPMLQLSWYIILKQDGKPVCVALYQRGFEITTITTALDERKKGHATYLMKYIADYFKENDVLTICPTEPYLLQACEKAGWTKADDTVNPDGTYDVMPDYVKSEYKRQTHRKDKRPLNERKIDNVLAFTDRLTAIQTLVAPTV